MGGNLARNWLCVRGQWLYHSLFLTCTFDPIVLKRVEEKVEQRREAGMDTGNQSMEIKD